jgi:hypothetical protein
MNSSNDLLAFEALDLDAIKAKLMDTKSGKGWSKQRVDAAEQEYRRFLYLAKKFPNEPTAPLVDVDEFWHYHILDTMKYAADCNRVFGYFLHHFPYAGMRGKEDEQALQRIGERTRALYEKTFGEDYYAGIAAAAGRPTTALSSGTRLDAAYGSPTPAAADDCVKAAEAAAYCVNAVEASAYCVKAVEASAYCVKAAETSAFCVKAVEASAYCVKAVEASAYCVKAVETSAYCVKAVEASAYCVKAVEASAYCVKAVEAPAYCVRAVEAAAHTEFMPTAKRIVRRRSAGNHMDLGRPEYRTGFYQERPTISA